METFTAMRLYRKQRKVVMDVDHIESHLSCHLISWQRKGSRHVSDLDVLLSQGLSQY